MLKIRELSSRRAAFTTTLFTSWTHWHLLSQFCFQLHLAIDIGLFFSCLAGVFWALFSALYDKKVIDLHEWAPP